MPELAFAAVGASRRCPECASELGEGMLACPGCRRLVHGDELKRIAAQASIARQADDVGAALAAWRSALPLLPSGSRQYQQIEAQVRALSDQLIAGPGASAGASKPGAKRRWGPAGIGAMLLAALGKGKLLLLGLSKLTTLVTMVVSFGVYWRLWGWKFALGVVLCTYVHEMGHVITLRRFGIPATAPAFIPGFGALVRLKQNPATAREDARTGLAGPIYGLGVTALVLALGFGMAWPSFIAIARVNALINLFNLTPVGSLDGGRAFRSLSKRQKWLAVAVLAALFAVTREGMLMLVGGAAAFNALSKRDVTETDPSMCVQFGAVAAALVAIASVQVPGL